MSPFEIVAIAVVSVLSYLAVAVLFTRLSLALGWESSPDDAEFDAILIGLAWPVMVPFAVLAYVVGGVALVFRWGAGIPKGEN